MINNFNKSLLPIVGDDSNVAIAAPLMMVDQVKAPATGGTSPGGTVEGAEPKTSTTGFGHIKEERPNPSTVAQELRTKCSCVCAQSKFNKIKYKYVAKDIR